MRASSAPNSLGSMADMTHIPVDISAQASASSPPLRPKLASVLEARAFEQRILVKFPV